MHIIYMLCAYVIKAHVHVVASFRGLGQLMVVAHNECIQELRKVWRIGKQVMIKCCVSDLRKSSIVITKQV